MQIVYLKLSSRGFAKQRLVEAVLMKNHSLLGEKGALVRVKPGFMRHCLYPSGTAIYATDRNMILYAKPRFDQISSKLSSLSPPPSSSSFTNNNGDNNSNQGDQNQKSNLMIESSNNNMQKE